VCGVPIVPKGPDVAIQQEKANRKPQMPEAEWRKRGFLTSPTKFQVKTDPAHGCCAKCGLLLTRKHFHYTALALGVLVGAVLLFAFVLTVVTFLPH
jgi:hypothetical protein